MRKQYWLTGENLKSYFDMDAEMLDAIEFGEVYEVDLIVDDENKTAEYRVTNKHNDAPYQTDDYNNVKEWLSNHQDLQGYEF